MGIETLLLIARAIVAVLFGHAIHALREEYSESAITMKEARELQERLEALSFELTQARENFQRRLASELAILRESLHQQLAFELSHVRESFHEQLSSELSPLHESIEHHQATLASLPAMQAHLRHLTSSLAAETHKRPVLRALPPVSQQHTQASGGIARTEATGAAEKFDARAFVFACLGENPNLKLAEIEQRARAAGQELSQPTVSRYRKQFFSTSESAHESSSMKAEKNHESSSMKAQDNGESATTDERKVVGE